MEPLELPDDELLALADDEPLEELALLDELDELPAVLDVAVPVDVELDALDATELPLEPVPVDEVPVEPALVDAAPLAPVAELPLSRTPGALKQPVAATSATREMQRFTIYPPF